MHVTISDEGGPLDKRGRKELRRGTGRLALRNQDLYYAQVDTAAIKNVFKRACSERALHGGRINHECCCQLYGSRSDPVAFTRDILTFHDDEQHLSCFHKRFSPIGVFFIINRARPQHGEKLGILIDFLYRPLRGMSSL